MRTYTRHNARFFYILGRYSLLMTNQTSVPSKGQRAFISPRSIQGLGLRIIASMGLVAAITFCTHSLTPVNPMTAGFIFLVGILVIATAGGLVESTIASVAAMLCFNFFFLPPVGTFTVSDPQNWVALFAFLATSLTASQRLRAPSAARRRRPSANWKWSALFARKRSAAC